MIPLNIRRTSGAFFTRKKLANRLIRLLPSTNHITIYCDPACGAGDLLIAACRTFPVRPRLADTLRLWGDHIVGFDCNEEFILAAKARLILLAVQSCSSFAGTSSIEWQNTFPHLKRVDGSQSLHELADSNNLVILLNPPYFSTVAPDDCSWAQGKVNSAALFVESCIKHCALNTKVAAILPEVLRSGSRYKKWREFLIAHSNDLKERIEDQFDGWTDINVYLTSFVVKSTADQAKAPTSRVRQGKNRYKPLIGDIFEVKVGPVVPHRDKRIGNQYLYIHARILKPWQIMKTLSESRKYPGTVFKPPFVAVRRTSRPGDKYRAIGTLINGSHPVAVENHLIVILPKDGTLRVCQLLLKSLKRKETTEWLDQRIRCRHLTVEAMKELPIFAAHQQSRNESE